MKKLSTALLISALAPSLALQPAMAGSVNVQTHVPVANASFMKNESASGPGRDRLFFGVDYNYLNEPLVELNPTRERRLETLVDSLQTLDLTVAKDFEGLFALGGTLPLNMIHETGRDQAFAMGDARLFGKFYLMGSRAPIQLSLMPEVTLPSGDQTRFLSDGSTGVGAMLTAEKTFRYFSLVANFGYRKNSGAIYRDMDYRQKLPIGIGALIPLTPKWAVNVEAAGNRILPLNKYNNPAEFYAGARYQVSDEAVLTGGASMGSTNQVASADYRILLGFRFSPQARVRDVIVNQRAGTVAVMPHGIELGKEVRFAHNSAEILPGSKPLLNEVARILKENPEHFATLDVEGHCNELGSDQYNMELSKRRAASVRAYLVSRGIEDSRLHAVGYGKRRPKPESLKMERERRLEVNRRVEFKATETM